MVARSGRAGRPSSRHIEPCYRPAFVFATDGGEYGTVHEVGLTLKFWTHRATYED